MTQWTQKGFQIMEDDDGFYTPGGSNTDYINASEINAMIMAAQGNKVISAAEVIAISPTPDLTVNVQAGTLQLGSTILPSFAGDATFDLSSHVPGVAGQSVYVLISVDSSGTITATPGTPLTTGNQVMPVNPEDEVLLAIVLLTNGQTQIDNNSIADGRIFVPDGLYVAGNGQFTGNVGIGGTPETNLHIFDSAPTNFQMERTGGSAGHWGARISGSGISGISSNSWHFRPIDADGDFYITNQANVLLFNIDTATGNVKNPVDNAGFYTGADDNLRVSHSGSSAKIDNTTGELRIRSLAGDIVLLLTGSFSIKDDDDSDVPLVELDTSARTLTVGKFDASTPDTIISNHYGEFRINVNGKITTDQMRLFTDTGFGYIDLDSGLGASGLKIRKFGSSPFIGPTDLMEITGAGNVGIGRTPIDAFNVHGIGATTIAAGSTRKGVDQTVGILRFYGYDAGDNDTIYGQIASLITNPTEGSEDGRLLFFTMKAGSLDEAMRIDSAGNVGIGGTPADILHVHKPTSSLARFTTAATGSTTNDGIAFGYDDSLGGIIWNRETSNIVFATSNNERMRIDASGNIKNPVDNAGYFTGLNDEVQLSWVDSPTFEGRLLVPGDNLQIVAGTATTTPRSVKIKVGGTFIVEDLDDSDETLFSLNTSTRDFIIGATDGNDNVNSSFYGNVGIGIDPTQNLHLPDNSKIGLGSLLGGDLQLYHDATHSWVLNATGSLFIASSGDTILRTGSSILIQDSDAGDANLFEFGTSTRTFTVGLSGFPIVTTFWGDVTHRGHVTPGVTKTYNLGTSSLQWATLYIDPTISAVPGTNVNISASGQVIAETSSRRFKDVGKIFKDSSDILYQFPDPFHYTYKENDIEQFGFMAEDLYEIFPMLVNLDLESLPVSIDYNKIVVLLVQNAKRQNKEIQELKRLLSV